MITDALIEEQKRAEEAEKQAASQKAQAQADSIVVDTQLSATGSTETEKPASSEVQVYTPDVPMRFNEKKRLHWSGKTCTSFELFTGNKRLTRRVHRSCTTYNRWKPGW